MMRMVKEWLWDFLNPQWQNDAPHFLIASLSVLCDLCGKKSLPRFMASEYPLFLPLPFLMAFLSALCALCGKITLSLAVGCEARYAVMNYGR